MNKIIGAVSVLSTAIALIFAQSTPTFGDVIVNNVLSPSQRFKSDRVKGTAVLAITTVLPITTVLHITTVLPLTAVLVITAPGAASAG